jgi:hypothetical protein
MRTAVSALVLAIALALAAVAAPARAAEPAAPTVDPALLSERHMRQPEILHEKPSGFWTSNRPATGGAYRYTLLLMGVAITAVMGTIIVVVIRRSARRPA